MTNRSGDRAPKRVARFVLATTSVAALLLLAPHITLAHNGGKIRGSCTADNTAGRATVSVKVDNLFDASVVNLKPSEISGSASGSATLFVQTAPRALRVIVP